MFRNHPLAALALLATLLCASFFGPAAAEPAYGPQKVVYHLSDIEQADRAFRFIRNHLSAVGDENVEIVVVTHYNGAYTLVEGEQDSQGNTFTTTIAGLANRGVRFEICENTIRGFKIDESLIDFNAVVTPSGVARIAELQQQGYAYLKP